MDQKQVVFNHDDLKPSYSNRVTVTTNENELTLDFFYDNPNTPIVLLKRISMSPAAAKGFIELVGQLLSEHEKTHGKIQALKPQSKIGFDTEGKTK